MRLVFVFLCIITHSICFGQASTAGDTLTSRIYDTTSIEIKSIAYFPFCSNIYNLPRDCNENLAPNCCSYYTSLRKNQKVADWGYVSCNNGSSFHWYYGSSFEGVKRSFEDAPKQWEKQQKSLSKKQIKCFIYNKEADAYIIEQETYQGNKFYVLTTYGSFNGFNFYLEYRSSKMIKDNEDIQPVFRQILRIQ